MIDLKEVTFGDRVSQEDIVDTMIKLERDTAPDPENPRGWRERLTVNQGGYIHLRKWFSDFKKLVGSNGI